MSIKAIETEYAGYRFRSRLEARWAVFFDAMQLKWKYEPQGFMIGCYYSDEQMDGAGHTTTYGCPWPYLPDFYLPDLDMWVEVKGDDERFDWTRAAVAVDGWSGSLLPYSKRAWRDGGSSLLVLGDIPRNPEWLHIEVVNSKGAYVRTFSFSNPSAGGLDIGVFDVTWSGCQGEVFWKADLLKWMDWDLPSVHGLDSITEDFWRNREPTPASAKVQEAYRAARQARFEHGEAG